MPNRFVILHHQLPGGEHWDLMLERGEVLLTWQLEREPVGVSDLPIAARRIGDHRKAYLDYEGPVSGGRGCVSQVDQGTVEWEKITPSRVVVVLQGERLIGRFRLIAEDEVWTFDIVP